MYLSSGMRSSINLRRIRVYWEPSWKGASCTQYPIAPSGCPWNPCLVPDTSFQCHTMANNFHSSSKSLCIYFEWLRKESVHSWFNIVSTRFVVASAGVEGGEEEVAREFLYVFFLDVDSLGFVFVELLAESEINQVNSFWVFVADQNVLQLQVVVDIA